MPGPGRLEWSLSAAIHVVVFAFLWFSSLTRPPEFDFERFAIEIVSLPPIELGVQEIPVPVEETFETIDDPDPVVVEEEPPPPVIEEVKKPDPEPAKVETAPPPTPDSVEKKPAEPPKGENPDPDSKDPGEDIVVKMEGLQRDFPRYYEEIVRHIRRCFRWGGDPSLKATVDFQIRKTGGLVRGPQVKDKSGSLRFDATATRAIECAVTLDRVGPLPEEMDEEFLPVRFVFQGRGNEGFQMPEGGSW